MIAVNYLIRAEVVDITSDVPRKKDKFLVDSNIWFWLTYSHASQSITRWRQNLIPIYPGYVNKALEVGAKLFYCGLSRAELAHLIEKTEQAILIATLKPKEFRHNFPQVRINVGEEVQASWSQVKSLAKSVTLKINQKTTDTALHRFQQTPVDGYDLFLLEAMFKQKMLSILTDDGDFATVPGIQVFTANRNVISAARSQGRLLVR